MRCESTRLCGVKMVYNDLENMLNEDNWDNGFEIPKEILADPRCDLALALEIFYDLHSGHFGGAVANPINVLCRIISKVTDTDGRITVPGFYDDVEEVPQAEREMIAHIPFDEKKYKEAIGVKELFGEKGYSTLERNSCRPSFDVCGIWGGYTGEGSKTVLPSKAYAKVSSQG